MGWKPAIEEIKMIEPFPLFSMWGTVDLANKNAALTFISNILSHASSGHCKKWRMVMMRRSIDSRLDLHSEWVQIQD